MADPACAEPVVPLTVTIGAPPVAPTMAPPEGVFGAIKGLAAVARPDWPKPTPTSEPTARPKTTAIPSRRDPVGMAAAPYVIGPMSSVPAAARRQAGCAGSGSSSGARRLG